jgi:SAM-dependent methyltransferase
VSAQVGASAGEAQGEAWREQGLVGSYLERRQILLPLIDIQEELLGRLLGRLQRPVARFLDLGCGDGAMAELVIERFPHASAMLVDFSEPMLARVAARMDRCAPGRWQSMRADLRRADWSRALPAGPFDAVVSGMAIHHLPSERKRALYAEVFALLAPGGLFLNMDYVSVQGPLSGLFDEEMHAKAAAHAQRSNRQGHEHAVRGGHGGHGEDAVVDDLDSDEDQPDSLPDQLRWLGEAGFAEAEVHFKWAEAAIFGAVRPGGGA